MRCCGPTLSDVIFPATAPQPSVIDGKTFVVIPVDPCGAGVFTSAGFQAAFNFKDPLTMMSTWVVGGVIALAGAATYAELGSLMPRAGGEYVYLREAYHPAVGFMSGFVSLVAGFSAPIAAAALLFASYVAAIVPGLGGAAIKIIAIALILAMTALHAYDTRIGGRVQTGFTIAKVALIVVFIGAGLLLGHGDWSHFAHRNDGLSQLGTRAGAASYATALIYVSFVLLYLAFQAVARSTSLTDDEYEANAMRVLEEAWSR